jgi:hypothetical protein
MLRRQVKPGDVVVYRKSKHSTRPGPRAKDVYAAQTGDDYSYYVDKFWVVAEVGDGGTLLLKTRLGKAHRVEADDPNLRHVTLWDRIRYGKRFPKLDEIDDKGAPTEL